MDHNPSAEVLLAQGETALLNGDFSLGIACFDAAVKLDPANSKSHFAQGLSLYDFGSQRGQEKALLLASKKFKAAAQLDPESFSCWHTWGSLLCTLGLKSGEHHYFMEAKEKLNKAISTAKDQGSDALSELYWDLGIVYAQLAERSEEILEWHQAIDAFQMAHSLHAHLPGDFWKDYGSAYLNFATQANDVRFFFKSVHALTSAVSLDPGSFDNWRLLATSLQKLYLHTHDEDHFSEANKAFDTATKLNPLDSQIWLQWARFLCDSSTRVSDVKRLRQAVEKCHRAHALDPDQPIVQAIWGEALALLGSYSERLDLIYDGQNKINAALDADEEDPEIWYSDGICCQAFGQYFEDIDYFYQAIEKFQAGLSIDRTCHRHWHAIGWTYSLIGDRENHPENLELSLRFFHKALDLHLSTYYLFDYAVALSKLGEMTQQERWLEAAIQQFEKLLSMQKNAAYLHPDWLFHYACTLDALGDFHEEELYYLRAIEAFSQALMVDPDFYLIHHHLALALSHLGDLTEEIDPFYRALHHFRLSAKNDDENDQVLLDWATTQINIATRMHDPIEAGQLLRDAEHKLQAALRLGNQHTYYYFACIHSLMGNSAKAMQWLLQARSSKALPPLDEIHQDEWIDNLRATPDFQEFISELEHRKNFQQER